MLPSSLYIGLTSGYLRLLESRGTPYTLKKTSNSTLSLVITSLRLSTFHESVSARLALERARARCCYLVVGSRVNRTCIQGVLPPWSHGDTPASLQSSNLVWSGVDDHVRGMWTRPSFVEKLFSRKRDQGDRRTWREPWSPSLCGESRGPRNRFGC